MLDWTQDNLAEASQVTQKTIADFERGARSPQPRTLTGLRHALETAGIEFIDPNGGGPGVRLRENPA